MLCLHHHTPNMLPGRLGYGYLRLQVLYPCWILLSPDRWWTTWCHMGNGENWVLYPRRRKVALIYILLSAEHTIIIVDHYIIRKMRLISHDERKDLISSSILSESSPIAIISSLSSTSLARRGSLHWSCSGTGQLVRLALVLAGLLVRGSQPVSCCRLNRFVPDVLLWSSFTIGQDDNFGDGVG